MRGAGRLLKGVEGGRRGQQLVRSSRYLCVCLHLRAHLRVWGCG